MSSDRSAQPAINVWRAAGSDSMAAEVESEIGTPGRAARKARIVAEYGSTAGD